jgi:hypothetical protein
MRGSGERKPKEWWDISRTLELTPSRRAFESPSGIAAQDPVAVLADRAGEPDERVQS